MAANGSFNKMRRVDFEFLGEDLMSLCFFRPIASINQAVVTKKTFTECYFPVSFTFFIFQSLEVLTYLM